MKLNDFVITTDNNHGNPVKGIGKIKRIDDASDWVEIEFSDGRKSVFHKRCLKPVNVTSFASGRELLNRKS